MAILKCKMCGGTMEILDGTTVAQCEYCGTKQTVPDLSDERKAELFDRANHFRFSNDYDRALRIYEQILRGDETDAEVYWSILLCRYGVEYVEDPATGKRIPTVNRTQRASIFNDPDYQMTLKYADAYQREIYESEAKQIDDIQRGILAISAREEPFDVFICYKETGDDGRRTKDSVLAFDIYKQLTKEGYKVFFARVTLEDKLGTAYEPYIFAALNSAKVMIVVGCKPEYFNAVWVKNEWSRFLAMINAGEKKVLIPAYCDMSPYDLPEEFSYLQAQDLSKIGAMQDLIHGIDKITGRNQKQNIDERPQKNYSETEALLKRAYLFLEQKDWNKAIQYCNRVLDRDPENFDGYFCALLAQHQLSNRKEFENYYTSGEPIQDIKVLNLAKRFAALKDKEWFSDLDEKRNETLENIRAQEEEAARLKREEEQRIQEEKIAQEKRLEYEKGQRFKKRKRTRRIISLSITGVLILCIVIGSLIIRNYFVSLGNGIDYHFDKKTGTLTISGNGDTRDFSIIYFNTGVNAPWRETNSSNISLGFFHNTIANVGFTADDIYQLEIEDGITHIGRELFQELPNIKEVKIPNSVVSLGVWSFAGCKSLEYVFLPHSISSLGAGSFSKYNDSYEKAIVVYDGTIEEWTSITSTQMYSCDRPDEKNGPTGFQTNGAKEIRCNNGSIYDVLDDNAPSTAYHHYEVSYIGTEEEWNGFYDSFISSNEVESYNLPKYVECSDGTISYD